MMKFGFHTTPLCELCFKVNFLSELEVKMLKNCKNVGLILVDMYELGFGKIQF